MVRNSNSVPIEDRSRRLLPYLAAVIILAYHAFFTWRGLAMYFDNDDMMNLYEAWRRPWPEVLQALAVFWSDFYRPAGAVFYRTIFAAAGFDPLPFRIACMAVTTANLGLFCWLARMVLPTGRAVAVAALLFAFHSRVMEIWFRTATIYDILCFSFFYLAVCVYVRARRGGRTPSALEAAGIVVCAVLALDSKEVAVALPVVLAAWELLFAKFDWRRWWLIGVLAMMNVPFILGKQSLKAEYKPEYSWARFSGNWGGYWNHLLLGPETGGNPMLAVGILVGLLAVGLGLRSAPLVWSWVVLFSTVLPVIFVDQRGAYVLYLAMPGLAIYAATFIEMLQDRILVFRPAWRQQLACVVFVLLGWRYGKAMLHDQRIDKVKNWLNESPGQVRTLAASLRSLQPKMKSGARVLILEDPFPTTEWTPTFVAGLLYNDSTIWVDRPKKMPAAPPNWLKYDVVITWQDGKYRQLKP